VHQLRVDSETLRTQLHDLQQVPSRVPCAHRKAAPCAEATNAITKSYRDALCPAGATPARNSLLELSTVSSDNPSGGDFITVLRKKRATPSAVNAAAVATSLKKNSRTFGFHKMLGSSLGAAQLAAPQEVRSK
jgi:hypothetical protein